MKVFPVFALLSTVVFLNGCVSVPTQSNSVSTKSIASRFGDTEEKVVARSGETPDWVSSDDTGFACSFAADGSVRKRSGSSSDERYYCFRSEYIKPAKSIINMNSVRAQARKGGQTALSEMLGTEVEANYESEESSNIDKGYVQETIKTFSKAKFSGLADTKSYWEKRTSLTTDGVTLNLHYYTLFRISEKDLKSSMNKFGRDNNLTPEMQDLVKRSTESVLSR